MWQVRVVDGGTSVHGQLAEPPSEPSRRSGGVRIGGENAFR
ncbi:hypothetical protein V6U81_28210 [Micromonospora sp. CPCC 205711]